MSRAESRSSQYDQCPSSHGFNPTISMTPDLPTIDFGLVGRQAPKLLETPIDQLPEADAVVIAWTSAEWAAMQHVFVSGDKPMPYSERNKHWDDWQEYKSDMPPPKPHDDWTYWGLYRLVEIQGRKVLLFKSNTHLDFPGQSYLEDMIRLMIQCVKPSLIVSTGTAGGSRTHDHLGTVNTVTAGVLVTKDTPPSEWPRYANDWRPNWSVVGKPDFPRLLFPVPTTESDLTSLATQYNDFYKTSFTLQQLNPNNVDCGDRQPKLNDMTGEGTSLLTAVSYQVGTNDGHYEQYACIEMDDAVIGKVCNEHKVSFGFFRNISDPIQSACIPYCNQKGWSSTIYEVYGLYSSYNGALNVWAVLDGQWSN